MIKTKKLLSIIFFAIILPHHIIKCDETPKQSAHTSSIDLTLPAPEKKSREKSKAKEQSSQPQPAEKRKRNMTYKDMSYDELEIAKNRLIEAKTWDSAIKYLEQMIQLCSDVQKIGQHLLEIGDLLFENAQYRRAALVYAEFASLYPGHPRIEYALYRGVISSFNCCLTSDRDQTKTEETIALANAFLINEHFTDHRDEIVSILTQCHKKIVESELNVCTFYLKRNKIKAVEKRLASIRATYLESNAYSYLDESLKASLVAGLEISVLTFEFEIAQRKCDPETAALKQAQLITLDPVLGAKLAANSAKKRMMDRF